ncbi:MAG: hypothetical protein GY775_06650 [Candidatus Scalindua sp.]|nr:hypothetical protein [Candidatus Scalindua sp.]
MAKNKRNIALAWYRQDQWQLLLDYSTDSDKLEPSYQEWLEHAEEKVNEISGDGITVVKVDINIEKMKKWCKRHNKQIDGYSRSEYAVFLAKNNLNILR